MSYLDDNVKVYLKEFEVKDMYYEIPIKDFLKEHKHVPIQLAVSGMINKAKFENLELIPFILYNVPTIVIYEKGYFIQNKAVTFSVPYSRREEYLGFILELDSLIEDDGTLAVFVSNIPYYLKCYVVIECLDSFETVHKMIKEQGLEIIEDQGLDEILKDAAKSHMWNGIPLLEGEFDGKRALIESLFYYETEIELHKKRNQF